MPRLFFEQHCFDCHDATEKKGGLDLDALTTNFADAENFGRWVKVHDHIESGEMSPKKRARPSTAENAAAVKWLLLVRFGFYFAKTGGVSRYFHHINSATPRA